MHFMYSENLMYDVTLMIIILSTITITLMTAEATLSSCLCDVSGTEPTTASVICAQKDPYDGGARSWLE